LELAKSLTLSFFINNLIFVINNWSLEFLIKILSKFHLFCQIIEQEALDKDEQDWIPRRSNED